MRIAVESTDIILIVNGRPARVWRGCTERGIAIEAFIPLIRVMNAEDQFQFQVKLEERPELPDRWTISEGGDGG